MKKIKLWCFSGQCPKYKSEFIGLTRKQVENNLRVHEDNCTGEKKQPQTEAAEA